MTAGAVVEYRVEVGTDVPQPSDDEFDDLVDALRPVSGVPGAPEVTLSVTLSVDAHDAPAAVNAGIDAMRVALEAISHTAGVMSVVAAPVDPNDPWDDPLSSFRPRSADHVVLRVQPEYWRNLP